MDNQEFLAVAERLHAQLADVKTTVKHLEDIIRDGYDERMSHLYPCHKQVLAATEIKPIPVLVTKLAGAVLSLKQIAYIEDGSVLKKLISTVAGFLPNEPELDHTVWALRLRTGGVTMEEAIDGYFAALLQASGTGTDGSLTDEELFDMFYGYATDTEYVAKETTAEAFRADCRTVIEEEIRLAYDAVGTSWS